MTHTWRAARLFTGDEVISPGFVAVRGDRILAVGGEPPPDPRIPVIDLGDATLLPGLVDAHSHVSIVPAAGDQIGQMRRPLDAQLAAAHRNLLRDLESGVTTMRVLGEERGVDFVMRDEIRAGAAAGPDLVCAGVQIAREGHHGHALTGVRDEADVAALAMKNIAAGAGVLKIFATGGVSTAGTSGDACPFSAREIARAAALAHEHGLKLAAHALGGEGARRAILGGVDTIEHGAALDGALIDEILRRGLTVVGTFSILFHPEGIERGDAGNPAVIEKVRAARESMARSWRALVAAGVRIAVGTDSMHGCIAHDVATLVEFGVAPLEALRAATAAGAETCGLADRGRLAPGLRADVVAVRGDATTDVARLGEPLLVIANGRIVKGGVPRTPPARIPAART